VLALLLDREPGLRNVQFAAMAEVDGALQHELRVLFQIVARLPRAVRLPLLGLAAPTLRGLPDAARAQLRRTARAVALADATLSPFEFALLRTLERHVRLDAERPPRSPGRPVALATLPQPTAIVLSVLARVGAHGDEAAAAAAFAQGSRDLAAAPALHLLPAAACSLAALEPALQALASVSPLGKRNLLTACARAAGADGVLQPDEADLLRALAENWDCPIPLVATPAGAPAATG
jgi:hypothetical protein